MTPTGEQEGVSTHYRVVGAILDRYQGGESMDSLARDYELPVWFIGYVCHGRRRARVPAFGYVRGPRGKP